MRKITNAFDALGESFQWNKLHSFTKLGKTILLIAVFCASVSVARATPISVTAFGAVGDGYTDNKIPIQNAINSLPSTGGTIYFPTGHYNVSGTLYVPSNARLQGEGSFYNDCQIRLTSTGVPLFEVLDGKSNITFKDLILHSLNGEGWPRISREETTLIRAEGTTGISLKAGESGISDIVIENVRISRFTRGVSATSSVSGDNTSISNVRIRNYASDGNEYSLYAKNRGADNWDVQNMNVFPMYHGQNGIFLERSGQMRFLNLSCAGLTTSNICAKMWDNGDTYFRDMHVEGPRLGFCVGTNCNPRLPETPVESSFLITVENSATDGEVYRATNLVSINNRFWLDFPQSGPLPQPRFRFYGAGVNSIVNTCADVWVKWDGATHMSDTTVVLPDPVTQPLYPVAFPGLPVANIQGCDSSYLSWVPTFSQGYVADNERLSGEVNVTAHGASPTPGDDTAGFLAALTYGRNNGKRRFFVPAGTFEINQPLNLLDGETFLGDTANPSIINLTVSNDSLFKVSAIPALVRAVTLRNLTLTATYNTGTIGIELTNAVSSPSGGAADFQIQNVDFTGFDKGVAVRPLNGTWTNAHPMFDSVSLKDADFSNNKTAVDIGSSNASNWNLENIRVNIPNGYEGVRINGAGVSGVRDLSCTSSGTGSACLTVVRQAAVAIDGLSATGVTNALVVSWENGWTQFPVTLRNSNLLAGVYFQGRVYLNSVNNTYPANFNNDVGPVVHFGAYQEGNTYNVAYGGQSDIFSCNDTFTDLSTSQSIWAYTGTLLKPVTYCY